MYKEYYMYIVFGWPISYGNPYSKLKLTDNHSMVL